VDLIQTASTVCSKSNIVNDRTGFEPIWARIKQYYQRYQDEQAVVNTIMTLNEA
jgi:hypothetical protein